LYYFKYPLAILLSLAPAVFVPFALPLAKANRDWRAFLVLVGGLALVHYAAYSLLNLPPYHWYYGIFISALALIGAGGLVVLAREGRAGRLTALALAAILALAGAAISAEAALARKQMPIHTNLGTVAQYRAIGEWLNAHMPTSEYHMIGELGVIQYYSHADAVNSFSDRQILRDFVSKLPDRSPSKWLAALNFAHLAARPPIRSDYLLEEDCKDRSGALKTWTTSSTWDDSVLWCLRRESAVNPASSRPD
ncbi:MAG: hypothetical protein P4L68_03760, partial [Methylovirgula sp.]|nr:hypothetical protein [Methylovirgula sp.]